MKPAFALLVAAVLLAHLPAPVQAQDRGWRGSQGQKQGLAPSRRENREEVRRERGERGERREQSREQRFTPEEREKLRQDLLDANRDMRGRKR